MTKSLLLMDTDEIKNYVFGTNKLKDIRGASAILDDLNRTDMPNIVDRLTSNNFIEIYSNGGVGEFIVPTESVDNIIQEVTKKYHEYGASVTCCSVTRPDNCNEKILIKQIAYEMQKKKASNRVNPVNSNSFFRICDICHYENASIRDEDNPDYYICSRCHSKRKKFGNIKITTKKYLSDKGETNKTMRCKLIKNLFQVGYPLTNELHFPDEIGDIDIYEQNYIALLYADGNDMRKRIYELDTLNDHRDFSKKVDDSIFLALAQAAKKNLLSMNNLFPFDVLLLGGDDLVLVCPAKNALDVAIEICKTFKEITTELTLSIGVAFAHKNFPIRMLLNVAESLLKAAKMERASIMNFENSVSENGNIYIKNRIEELRHGAINFMVISNSSTLLYDDYYNDTLLATFNDEKFIKTFRPYGPDKLQALINKINLMKKNKIPKSKLEYLGEALFNDKFNSMLKTLFVFARSKNEHRKILKELFNLFPATTNLYPWQKISEPNLIYRTPILDILDIYRFLGE